MASCGEDANGQVALDNGEVKRDAISLQEAFLQFRRKKQVYEQKQCVQGMMNTFISG